MKDVTRESCHRRIARAIERLNADPADPGGGAALAEAAAYSPFHFLRIFRAMVGESPAAVARRLRLERAARALLDPQATVLNVALDAGYESPEAFSRAFRAAYGLAPRDWRGPWPRPAYAPPLPPALRLDPRSLTLALEPLQGGTTMEVRVEPRPAMLLLKRRHIGPYDRISRAFGELGARAGAAGLAPAGPMIGLYHDDPESAPPETLRADACIALAAPPPAVPEGLELERLPAGRWAIHTLHGPYAGIPDAFRRLYGLWLPESGEEPDDRPALEIYLDEPSSTPEAELRTELCLPLRG
ncbi:AraC family transcriptional regulator [Albimonas pacifica]|uniref:Transcriptional regulator, AraC family n=1 Tax=Albimonas pacifica TaxID=1114924 RepID=A0A1I3NUS3_9RHOB|nr:AraC family transcriptional regulator [Albimonas pacifica]SFJ13025.1 transcriptional regulator, AraC family [Albimonas pacifica]